MKLSVVNIDVLSKCTRFWCSAYANDSFNSVVRDHFYSSLSDLLWHQSHV